MVQLAFLLTSMFQIISAFHKSSISVFAAVTSPWKVTHTVSLSCSSECEPGSQSHFHDYPVVGAVSGDAHCFVSWLHGTGLLSEGRSNMCFASRSMFSNRIDLQRSRSRVSTDNGIMSPFPFWFAVHTAADLAWLNLSQHVHCLRQSLRTEKQSERSQQW